MKTVTLAKWRRLQRSASPRGTFTVLAIDHRGPLRRALARQSPGHEADEHLAALKEDIVRALAPHASAVLLDPEVGLPHCLRRGVIPDTTGLLVAQDTGSTGEPGVFTTSLVLDWSVTDTARIGAAGAKLLVYYHPDSPDARAVEDLVHGVARACHENQLPLFLEPLAYSLEQPGAPLPSQARRRVVLETARRLVPLGADVLKAEFPLNVIEQPDRRIWKEACAELSQASEVPWVLLSGGAPWDVFLRQAETACDAGASGVMAGRAFWKEAVTPDIPGRREFLAGEGSDRLRRLRELCDSRARPLSALLAPG